MSKPSQAKQIEELNTSLQVDHTVVPFRAKEFHEVKHGKDVNKLASTFSKKKDWSYYPTLQVFHRNTHLAEDARRCLETHERCDRGGFLTIGRRSNADHYAVVASCAYPKTGDMVFTNDGFLGPVVYCEMPSMHIWVLCALHDDSYNADNGLWKNEDYASTEMRVCLRRYKRNHVVTLPTAVVERDILAPLSAKFGVDLRTNIYNMTQVFFGSPAYEVLKTEVKRPSRDRKRGASDDDDTHTEEKSAKKSKSAKQKPTQNGEAKASKSSSKQTQLEAHAPADAATE